MSIGVKVSGAWKDVATPSIKVGGSWKDIVQAYEKVSGVWEELLSAGLTSLTFVASATSSGSTITVPGTALAGDIAILIDGTTGFKTPTNVVPSGWTGIGSLYSVTGKNGAAIRVSRKILVSGDIGANVTGMHEVSEAKTMIVLRPNATINTVTLGTINNEGTAGNPSSQTVSASGQPTPLVVIGAACTESGTAAFSTASPAFDAELAPSVDSKVGYKIYNSSPADHSIDMADLGNGQVLVSFYLRVS